MARRRASRAHVSALVSISTVAALLAPAFAGATGLALAVEPRTNSRNTPFEPAGAWVGGVFHVTHGWFGLWHFAYDPVEDEWRELPRSPWTLPEANAASLDGRLVVAGGRSSSMSGCVATARGPVCPHVSAYDPNSRSWTRLPDMPTPRSDAGVAVVNGKLYVVGGRGSDAAASAVERYDPATNAWTTLTPLPFGRTDATSLVALNGALYLVGGRGLEGNATKTTWVYRPTLNVWSPALDFPVRTMWAVAGTCQGRVLVFGGWEYEDGAAYANRSSTVRALNPVTQQWSTVANFSTWPMPVRGALTAGDLTMAKGAFDTSVLRCPTGSGPWETMPDLVADDVGFAPASPAHGDLVTPTATVRNRGGVEAPPSKIEFSFRNVFGTVVHGTANVSAIPAGGSVTVEGPLWTAIGGDRDLLVRVDSQRDVAEWDENNNNEYVERIHVREADLVTPSVVVVPANAGPGEPVRVSAVVRNDGDADAVSGTVIMTLNGAILSPFPALPAIAVGGETTVVSREFAMPATPSEVRVNPFLPNGHERTVLNNERRITIVGALADLVPLDLVASPASPREGDAVTLAAAVRNAGAHSASAFAVRFLVDGATLDEVRVDGLAEGAQATIESAAWSAVEGDHEIAVAIDPFAEVTESQESDNNLTVALLVGPPRRPDLVVGEISVSPADPHPGERVTTRVVVSNLGESASPAANATFSVDGDPLGTATVPALAPGESATIEAPETWLALPDSFLLRVLVDAGSSLEESVEDNNAAERSVDVTPGPP